MDVIAKQPLTVEEVTGRKLTIDELASKWQVPKSWLYRRSMEKGPGAIPRVKIGKYLRFDNAAVEQWLKARQGDV